MPSIETDLLVAFLTAPENEPLFYDFLADLDGDPHGYGYDEAPTSAVELGDALRTFVRAAARAGTLDNDIASLAESPDVDWTRVMQVVAEPL